MLAIIPREGWSRQNQFKYNVYVRHSIDLYNRTKTDNLKKGHTKLSKQFVRSNHSYSQQHKMSSSSSTTRSSKLKRSDIESNERVEKILRERKAGSKLRNETRMKKKAERKRGRDQETEAYWPPS